MADPVTNPVHTADLLIELGCEELPPKALDKIRVALFDSIKAGLENSNISFNSTASRSFSTPRRLAVLFSDVIARQADQTQARRGPALTAAFDGEGQPTGAALGFARSVGKEVTELERIENDKGSWLFATVHLPGKPLEELIYPILEQAVKKLPVPKPMRWGNNDFSFVRPVHWLVVLHGERIINGALLGQTAGNQTRGHRIHSPGPHRINTANEYATILENSCVIADQEQRINIIRQSLEQADAHVHIDPSLLGEVNNLVEWPVAVSCTFDRGFLKVPHSALIASMQDHQKFFPVLEGNDSKQISNRFVAISNIDSTDISSVREGYERVIRPRLADARFFLEQDQKQALDSYLPRLDRVIFQQKIGTIGDKSKRIASISAKLAELLDIDSETCARAASLSKCDLVTQMVGEFPELQGQMGRHYAFSSGETAEVAEAIGEHYSPRFAGDAIPTTGPGQVIAISDRIDTLVSIFAAGLRPSGNKDPFALRRAALGLVRILLEAGLEVPLSKLLSLAATELSEQLDVDSQLLGAVQDFIVERLRHYYREKDFAADLVNAALASGWDTLPDLDRRLKAIDGFMGQDAAASLAAANKRIGNILRKSDQSFSREIDTDLFILSQESILFEEITRLGKKVEPLIENGEYHACLLLLAGLREPIDAFFGTVMVMDENHQLRDNRLALLYQLKSTFDQIADLSVLG